MHPDSSCTKQSSSPVLGDEFNFPLKRTIAIHTVKKLHLHEEALLQLPLSTRSLQHSCHQATLTIKQSPPRSRSAPAEAPVPRIAACQRSLVGLLSCSQARNYCQHSTESVSRLSNTESLSASLIPQSSAHPRNAAFTL